MAATNTTTAKKATTATTTAASNKATTITASSAATGTTSNAAKASASSPSSSSTPGTSNSLLPTFDLASFLGLPSMIDYQDIAIRVAMVITGIVLLILVGWAFVRGKQTTNVQIVAPSQEAANAPKAAEEAAEVTA